MFLSGSLKRFLPKCLPISNNAFNSSITTRSFHSNVIQSVKRESIPQGNLFQGHLGFINPHLGEKKGENAFSDLFLLENLFPINNNKPNPIEETLQKERLETLSTLRKRKKKMRKHKHKKLRKKTRFERLRT